MMLSNKIFTFLVFSMFLNSVIAKADAVFDNQNLLEKYKDDYSDKILKIQKDNEKNDIKKVIPLEDKIDKYNAEYRLN